MSGRKLVLVDMDGTLTDVSHRIHHLKTPRKNWKAFFRGMDVDPPSEGVLRWVRNLEPDYEVVIVTGRPEEFRRTTEEWLARHDVRYAKLLMRSNGDHRPDYVVKKQLLNHVPKNEVAFVIDDRPSVCAMWRDCGLKVYQVSAGIED